MEQEDRSTAHVELMTTLAVFQATVNGKLDAINSHLATLNGQTAKNTGAIQTLQLQDRDMMNLLTTSKNRDDANDETKNRWKNQWRDLLFGTLQWVVPAIIIGILVNGRRIAEFLGYN